MPVRRLLLLRLAGARVGAAQRTGIPWLRRAGSRLRRQPLAAIAALHRDDTEVLPAVIDFIFYFCIVGVYFSGFHFRGLFSFASPF